MAEARRVHAFVRGNVQGVFFRDFAKRTADALEITGWCRNTPDGRVEVIAEGEDVKIKALLAELRRGTEWAVVSGIDVEEEEPTGEFEGFEIKYSY